MARRKQPEQPIDARRPDDRAGDADDPDAHAGRGGRGRVPRVLDERDRVARAARRPRRSQAVAAPHPLGDARREPAPRPPVREVRTRRRRRDGQLPPARRLRDLRRARAHGPAVLAHRAAHRQARQLRLALRPAGREPLHRVPACRSSRWSCSPGSTKAPSTSTPTTTRRDPGAGGAAGAFPEPARERRRRASRWGWPPTSRRTTSPRCATRR